MSEIVPRWEWRVAGEAAAAAARRVAGLVGSERESDELYLLSSDGGGAHGERKQADVQCRKVQSTACRPCSSKLCCAQPPTNPPRPAAACA